MRHVRRRESLTGSRRLAAVALAALLVPASACGGDDTASPEPTTAGPVASDPALAATSTSPPRPTLPTTSPPNPEFAQYCQTMMATFEAVSGEDSAAATLAGVKEAIGTIAGVAPAPIKADVSLYDGWVQGLTEDSSVDVDPPPDVAAADERIKSWHKANCGFG